MIFELVNCGIENSLDLDSVFDIGKVELRSLLGFSLDPFCSLTILLHVRNSGLINPPWLVKKIIYNLIFISLSAIF